MVTLGFEHREQKDEESTYATLQTSDCTDEVDIRSKKNNKKITKKNNPQNRTMTLLETTRPRRVMHAPYNHETIVLV